MGDFVIKLTIPFELCWYIFYLKMNVINGRSLCIIWTEVKNFDKENEAQKPMLNIVNQIPLNKHQIENAS